jgi:hypothetical protein
VITSAADRFEKYPAYIEDFESYNKGTALKSNNARDLNAWTINPKGSDLKVESFAGSKVLSVTGNSILENTKIPGNLTAGDSYAKKQAWEVTITIPDGIGSDAKMVLLNYEADRAEFADGGFKLQGNAIYYALLAIFFAQFYGIELGMAQYVAIAVTASLGSIGQAGVPGPTLMVVAVLAAAGIPIEGLPLLYALDRIFDMIRTVLNITGDAACAVVTDRFATK